jgi:hypothetical protein
MKRIWQRLRAARTPEGMDALRFGLLWRFGRWVFPTYRFEWHQIDWWRNADFNRYLDRFDERLGFNTARRWGVSQLTRLVAAVPGDTAECGVFKGAALPRTHFCFDSFEGLSEPTSADGSYWARGNLTFGVEGVKQALASLPDVRFCRGWIPAPFAEAEDRRFAFVHIDVDLYEPTRDSMAFFYPRLSPGGIIVCDDYAYSTCPGATRAVDEYLADKPERMIALPSGGGFLIKGCTTGDAPHLS